MGVSLRANSVPCLDEFAHLKMHVSTDVRCCGFVSCISELLSCSFGAVITWNTKTGVCVHLIKSNFVVLKQQFGLKTN